MRLRALELEQFKKFGPRVRLSGFGDNMNILCGPNEFGKSTILAAIRSLLFERHSSEAKPIKRLQRLGGDAAPRAAMEFEVAGSTWRIEKHFLHKPMARLTAQHGGVFDNDAAEEKLQSLLGFGASGNQGAKHEHMGVWGALWVTQRESVLQPDLSSDLVRASFTSCLDAEVGVMTGSEKGHAILKAIREQTGKLIDQKGKPRERYRAVMEAIKANAASLADLRAKAEGLAEDVDELATRNDALRKAVDPDAEKRESEKLAEARRNKAAAQLFEARLRAATADLALADRDLAAAERERTARATRAAALLRLQSQREAGSDPVAPERAEAEKAETAHGTSRALAEAAQVRAAAATQAARRARDIATLAAQSASLCRAETGVAEAEAVQQRIDETEARLGTMPVDRARIADVRKATRDSNQARQALLAQATIVELDLHPGAEAKIRIAGQAAASGSLSLEVVGETNILIEGVGQIRIRPVIRDKAKLVAGETAASDRLADLLRKLDCRDSGMAEERHLAREETGTTLADLRAGLARLIPGDAAPGLAAWREQVLVQREAFRQAASTLGLDVRSSPDEAGSAALQAEEDERKAADVLAQARLDRDQAAKFESECLAARLLAEAAEREAASKRENLKAEADLAEKRESTEALTRRIDTAAASQRNLAEALRTVELERPRDTTEDMDARIKRHEEAAALRQKTIRTEREKIVELTTRITQTGGLGLDEEIRKAEAEGAALLLERQGYDRDVSVLKLLENTLLAAEREAKKRYLEPVRRRVEPYLHSLFPGADIACNDALEITGITRDVLGAQDFDRLSDGTQEQIAILARLAFAEMLIDQGKPAMVILDDPLAYSDEKRMDCMFDILTRAAAKTQILVLTCRDDLFSQLGGSRLTLSHASASAAA